MTPRQRRNLPADERRRHPRRPLRYVQLQAPVVGEVVDMSPAGMKVESYQALAVGARRLFVLGKGRDLVRVRGIVRWCRLLGTRSTVEGEVLPVFRAGIVFVGLDGEPAAGGGENDD